MSKKSFKESTVGKMLLGAASLINPTLGNKSIIEKSII